MFENFRHSRKGPCSRHFRIYRFIKIFTSKIAKRMRIVKLKTMKSLNVFKKSCAGGLWESGQESLDHQKKPLVLFKQLMSKEFNKEIQQAPSVNEARKVEAIFNAVFCAMQLFPHARRETQSTKAACVFKCGRTHLLQGTEVRLEQLNISLME